MRSFLGICIILIIVKIFYNIPLAQARSFLSVIEDIPLMSALVEVRDRAVVFETRNGRIAEAFAVGNVDQEEVIEFYKRSLPQLGWSINSVTKFWREDEILELQFLKVESKLKQVIVHFKLTPINFKD